MEYIMDDLNNGESLLEVRKRYGLSKSEASNAFAKHLLNKGRRSKVSEMPQKRLGQSWGVMGYIELPKGDIEHLNAIEKPKGLKKLLGLFKGGAK